MLKTLEMLHKMWVVVVKMYSQFSKLAVIHITLVRLLCPSMEKKDKILSAHNQIDTGNLFSNV